MKRLQTLLGFAAKAGAVVSGSAAVEAGIKKGRIKLVVCAADLSARTIAKFNFLCKENRICFHCYGILSELSLWIGNPGRGVIGITSKQFADTIGSLFNDGGEHHK
ncbi:MAG: 50S ribosomal protein L7ae [Firmicutes bacterium]|nr:50S ribosomal protein L7ae [Bacillota bacterium]